MDKTTQRLAAALQAHLHPKRSLLLAMGGVIVRGAMWALLIFGLAAIVPRVLPALQGINPKMPAPQGPAMDLINFMRSPQLALPAVLVWLIVVDFPISYLTSNSLSGRRWWSRLMCFAPIGIGLVAGVGFAAMYIQLIQLMVKEVGG